MLNIQERKDMVIVMDYDVVIGLEIHAELFTKTKIYCGCKNSFGSAVNSNVCPICAGLPGTLPSLNEKVVEYALKTGLALNCKINQRSRQDRKNYFYPDLPKGYQISQHNIPLCESGYVDIIIDDSCNTKRIGITRIHIEEDAGKLIHSDEFNESLIDLNRSGVPLIEIVSEPDIFSAAEAKTYLETIKSILQCLGVSDCKMQEGSIRCDVNVSLKPQGSEILGTRCEMKNVNTFNGVYRAIQFEINRQSKILDEGGIIDQETRRWDDEKGENVILRSKEDSHDYRYFPEPDLMAIHITDDQFHQVKQSIPCLPNVKIIKYVSEYNIPFADASLIASDIQKSNFFENTLALSATNPKLISNWILGDISKILNENKIQLTDSKITPEKLSEIIQLIESGKISNTAAKLIIEDIMLTDTTVADVINSRNLLQVSDTSVLRDIVKDVLSNNPQITDMFKKGKTNIIGFAVGQCMKISNGQGNPEMLKDIILETIGSSK